MVDPTAQTDARKWRIAQRLREARQNQTSKLSQAGLAQRVNDAGLTYFKTTHASRLECGYLDATWKEVEAIARVLGVTEHWLTNRADADAIPPAAAPAASPPTAAQAPASAPSAPATTPAPTLPINTSPEDPLLPDATILEQGRRSTHDYRQGLVDALARATEMLHRSGIPARTWRAWRDFDRQLRETLRQLPAD